MTNHTNDERTVRCPVEGCDAAPLARGINLHILRSSGDGHGPQGEVPDHISLDNLETVGNREVEMDYPEERDAEDVKRLCPYCKRPFGGKQGVMIHLGATAGRKNHPEDAAERHELHDFPVVKVDEDENVVVTEEGTSPPATERIKENEYDSVEINADSIREHIKGLREQGLIREAERAEELLLGKE